LKKVDSKDVYSDARFGGKGIGRRDHWSWLLVASKNLTGQQEPLPPLKNPDGRSWVTYTLPKDTPNLCLREQTCLQYSNQVSQV